MMSRVEVIFALETKTSQQAEVEAGPGDDRDVDWKVNLREISGKITDARLMLKYIDIRYKCWNILRN